MCMAAVETLMRYFERASLAIVCNITGGNEVQPYLHLGNHFGTLFMEARELEGPIDVDFEHGPHLCRVQLNNSLQQCVLSGVKDENFNVYDFLAEAIPLTLQFLVIRNAAALGNATNLLLGLLQLQAHLRPLVLGRTAPKDDGGRGGGEDEVVGDGLCRCQCHHW